MKSHTPDKEVQGMLRRSAEICGDLPEGRKIQYVFYCRKHSENLRHSTFLNYNFHRCRSSEDIDESIAMLLEYAEDLDIVPNRESHYPVTSENLAKVEIDFQI